MQFNMDRQLPNIIIGLFIGVLFLLPFSRLAELPILILSIIGIVLLIKQKIPFKSERIKTLTIVYFCYLFMILISAIDSYWPDKTFIVGLASLRFYLASLAIITVLKPHHFKLLINIIAMFALFLAIDALIQYFLGFDLIGRQSYPGRLNGIFGEDHAKLGPLLALLFPFLLISLQNTKTWIRWIAVLITLISVTLTGTRSAWIMLIFTSIVYFFYHIKQKRIQLIIKSTIATFILLLSLWFISPEFKQRIDRSFALFQGSEESIDFALANRLSIWKSSINMINAHPINGVGAHGFRKAYPKFAEKGDYWQQNGGVGMHAHHWILEVLSETGLIGFLIIIYAITRLFRFIKPYFNQKYSWAFSISLISAFLPITSTYSIFASFWSICIWFVGCGLILVSLENEKD